MIGCSSNHLSREGANLCRRKRKGTKGVTYPTIEGSSRFLGVHGGKVFLPRYERKKKRKRFDLFSTRTDLYLEKNTRHQIRGGCRKKEVGASGGEKNVNQISLRERLHREKDLLFSNAGLPLREGVCPMHLLKKEKLPCLLPRRVFQGRKRSLSLIRS